MAVAQRDDVVLHYEVSAFLFREAELLDAGDFGAWLETVTEDIDYEMPIRSTGDRSTGPIFSDISYFLKEDWHSLKARIDRFDTEYAWSEDPPSRTRRFVSNIRLADHAADSVAVRSNFMLSRARGEMVEGAIFTGERQDLLRRVDGDLKLAKRRILIDHTILPMRDVAIFV